MSSLARLKEELHARQSELHAKENTLEAIKKITAELEAKKNALEASAAELNDHQNEVTAMQTRLDALMAAEPAIDAAMRSKSSTTDVVVHVLEKSIRSGHLTVSDIVGLALDAALRIKGGSRGDKIEDLLVDLAENQEGLDAAVGSAMASFAGVNDVVKSALTAALKHGAKAEDLTETVAKTVFDMLGNATPAQPLKETPIANVEAVNLPKENASPGGQSHATPGNNTGLRGQANDFKPRTDSNGNYNSGGWEAFARENGKVKLERVSIPALERDV